MERVNISAADVDRIERRYGALTADPVGFLAREAAKVELQERRQAWVAKYGVKCFRCAAAVAEWAKLGVTNGRRWAICSRCVRAK